MKHRSMILVLLTVVLLSGCSWLVGDSGLIKDRKDAYREARPAEPPQVPEDLSADAIADAMVVPEVLGMERYAREEEFSLPRPSTLFAREEDRGVRIQRLGDERWIVAPAPPELVWPRVEQFLADNGVDVVAEDPEAGIIETGWVEVSASQYRDIVRAIIAETFEPEVPAPFHRLRLRVEQAVRRGSAEIHLLHEAGAAPAGMRWPPRSSDDDVESEMLNELAAYIAAGVGTTGVSLVAQDIAAQAKAEVVRDDDNDPMLRLRLGRERAWATIASALANAEIPVLAEDEDALSYDIEFSEARYDDSGNWITDLLSFGGKVQGRFQLRMTGTDDGYEVRVFDAEDGDRVDDEVGETVLSVLREFAS